MILIGIFKLKMELSFVKLNNFAFLKQARRSRRDHYGHLHRSHGAQLHGGPSQQQAEVGAGVGGSVRIRGRTIRHNRGVQGECATGEQWRLTLIIMRPYFLNIKLIITN